MATRMTYTHCRTCQAALKGRGYYIREGFCHAACSQAYVPVLRTVLCGYEVCTRGEGRTRKVFTTFNPRSKFCSIPCSKAQWAREQAAAMAKARAGLGKEPGVLIDLPADVIDRKLVALAKRRRETRSWLRITDPWQQRSGSELHKQTCVETYSLEGAML